MVKITYLPVFVTLVFRGMPGIWKDRHRLLLSWLIVMQALFPGRKTVTELARWTPIEVTALRFRRLLKAAYWDVHGLVAGWAQQAMNVLPPPEDGVLTLTGDGSDKPKRGKQNPLAQKGRKSQHDPWFFGIRFALLIVSWDVFRLPVAFRLIRLKTDTLNRQRFKNRVLWEHFDTMAAQHLPSNLLHSVANDDQSHVSARVRYPFVSWHA